MISLDQPSNWLEIVYGYVIQELRSNQFVLRVSMSKFQHYGRPLYYWNYLVKQLKRGLKKLKVDVKD